MCNENYANNGSRHEAAEAHTPAASASGIINREKTMSKIWPFLGGIIIGAASVVMAALVADKMDSGTSQDTQSGEAKAPLALPECVTG